MLHNVTMRWFVAPVALWTATTLGACSGDEFIEGSGGAGTGASATGGEGAAQGGGGAGASAAGGGGAGGMGCVVSDPTCGGLLNTDAHCGECDHPCPGGAPCLDGMCPAETIADASGDLFELHGDWLVFSRDDSPEFAVTRVPKNGGPLVDLAMTASRARWLYSLGDHLYWSVSSTTTPGGIYRANVSSAVTEEIAPSASALGGLVITSGYLYFAEGGFTGGLRRRTIDLATLDLGEPFPIGEATPAPWPVRLHDGFVYWAYAGADNQGIQGGIQRTPVQGGPIEVLHEGPGSLVIRDLAVHDGWVYWSGDLGVHRMMPGDEEAEEIATAPALQLVVTADAVYWLDQDAKLFKRRLECDALAPPVLLWEGTSSSSGLAVDDEWVYFTAHSDVVRLPR